MNVKRLVCATALLAAGPASARAAEPVPLTTIVSTEAVFLPQQHLFAPLTADPREIQLSAAYYRFKGTNEADGALGHSWGMARWESDNGLWAWQWDIEGMAYSRFQLSEGINRFEAVDFFLNVPLEVRRGIFAGKFMVYHESAHLGDDYIRTTGNTGFRYSVEGARATLDVQTCRYLRLYAGGSYLFHRIPAQGRGMLQAGFEADSPEFSLIGRGRELLYLSQDVQWREYVQWNPSSNTQLGVRFLGTKRLEDIRVYFDYFSGHSPYGQFYLLPEHYAQIGVGFDF